MYNLEHHSTCQLSDPREIRETEDAVKRAPKNLPGVHFVPWIGKKYGESALFNGKRLLILGESHYEWCALCGKNGTKRGNDFTCRCVAELVVDGTNSIQHWRNIEYTLTKDALDQAARTVFWHSVAYYNYIQEIVGAFEGGGRPSRPTPQKWENAEDPFLEIIKYLSPDIVVVLGFTMWDKLPNEHGKLASVAENGKELERCYYHFNNRTTIALRVRHPAAGLGRPWYPVLRKELRRMRKVTK